MAAEGFPVARIDEYAKPCEPAIHVLRSVFRTLFQQCDAATPAPAGMVILAMHIAFAL